MKYPRGCVYIRIEKHQGNWIAKKSPDNSYLKALRDADNTLWTTDLTAALSYNTKGLTANRATARLEAVGYEVKITE